MNNISVRFCTRCGLALDAAAAPGSSPPCTHCSNVSSLGARIIVACCILHQDRLLWIRRAFEPRRGFWAIPTGFLESGETPTQGAVRELFEETGLELFESDLKLHGLGSVQHMNEVYIVFRAKISREVPLLPRDEALEARFFTESEFPWAELAFPTTNYLARRTYADMRRGRHGVYLAQHDREIYTDQS